MELYEGTYASLDKAIGAEIKDRLRGMRGVSLTSIAEARNLRRATLSARVNGHAPFSLSLLGVFAEELGTTATELTAAAERRRQGTARAGQDAPGADVVGVAS